VLVRVRTGRVLYAPAPSVEHRGRGRVRVHGARLVLANPEPAPTLSMVIHEGDREVVLEAWANQHAKSNFADHDVTGAWVLGATTVGSTRKPLWLWYSGPEPGPDLSRLYYAYLRRFDIEHFFGFTKQRLASPGWPYVVLKQLYDGYVWSWPPTPSWYWLKRAPLIYDYPGRRS
jgi:hypothetical protein